MSQSITIMLLNEQETPLLEHMIPKKLMEMAKTEELFFLGVKGPEEIMMGVAVFREYAHYMELLWVYVEPEFRKMKLATRLLKKMEDTVRNSDYFLGVCADYESQEYTALDALLGTSGFDREVQNWPIYEFYLSDTYALDEFYKKNRKKLKVKGLCKIQECADAMKKRFSHTLTYDDEMQLIESPIDWNHYDNELSCVYVENNEIKGILLLESAEEQINIAFAYAKDNPYVFPYMLGESFYGAINKYQGKNPEITVTVFDDNTENLLLKLVPNATPVTMIHAKKSSI